MEDNLYLNLVHVLALDTFARCVKDSEARAYYEHFCENRLEIPPDILSRLGVMKPMEPDNRMDALRHCFVSPWTPRQPLVLHRHDGAPSIFDLIVAVCMLLEWNDVQIQAKAGAPVPSLSDFPELDLSDDRRFNSEPQMTFRSLVFHKAAHHIGRLGLGQWNEDNRFELISPLLGNSPIDLADSYDETRRLTALRLGEVHFLFPPN